MSWFSYILYNIFGRGEETLLCAALCPHACQKLTTGTTETLILEEIRQLLLFVVAEEGCCPLAPLHRGK